MNQLEQIQQSIEATKQLISNAKALERLKQNKDFQELILQGYLENYAANLVHSRAIVYSDPKQRDFVENNMTAIGCFKQYLGMIMTSGITAEASLASHEEERDRLLNEEVMTHADL